MNLVKFSVKRAERKITPWEGCCPAYNFLTKENVINIKKLHSQTLLLVYPECRPEVCNLADYIGNNKGIIDFVQTNPAKEYIIGTELDILYPLKKNNPDKQFFPAFEKMICQDMKLITLEKILYSLKNLEPQVTVPKKHNMRKSSNSLNSMLEISK